MCGKKKVFIKLIHGVFVKKNMRKTDSAASFDTETKLFFVYIICGYASISIAKLLTSLSIHPSVNLPYPFWGHGVAAASSGYVGRRLQPTLHRSPCTLRDTF